MRFVQSHLSPSEIRNKQILEVGSLDVNGSIRPYIESWGPARYIGIDMRAGSKVDRVVRCEDLIETFGERAFDIVVSVGMLEHAQNWSACLHNMMGVLAEGGWLLLTTCSRGFPYHGFPHDYWRFGSDDFDRILEQANFAMWSVQADPDQPGVFVKACKPAAWQMPPDAWLEIKPAPPG